MCMNYIHTIDGNFLIILSRKKKVLRLPAIDLQKKKNTQIGPFTTNSLVNNKCRINTINKFFNISNFN